MSLFFVIVVLIEVRLVFNSGVDLFGEFHLQDGDKTRNVSFPFELILFFPTALQNLFQAWLAEKEEALSEVQTSNFKDPSEMNTNVRRLAVSSLPSLCSRCHSRYF